MSEEVKGESWKKKHAVGATRKRAEQVKPMTHSFVTGARMAHSARAVSRNMDMLSTSDEDCIRKMYPVLAG